ncbi:hypothetical protein [Streptomyces misionensis]|uniref:hypothetical protein n=1 Tax=Streptomyces misionensis TaxID=67331 RepID=UPI00396B7440
MTAFVEDLRTGRFHSAPRVKCVPRAPGVYELTWSMGTSPTTMSGQARSSVAVIRDPTPHDHRKSCLPPSRLA